MQEQNENKENEEKKIAQEPENDLLNTKIMEEPVTRGTALLVNLIVICIIIAAIAAEGALIISTVATLCAGYLVRRLNGSNE